VDEPTVAALFAAVYECSKLLLFFSSLIAVWACLGASSPEFEEGTGAALFGSAIVC
jgi:hypothetical protein